MAELKIFGFNITREKRHQKQSKVARLLVSGVGAAISSDKDYEQYSNETYLKNVITFRCIHEIAQGCSFPKWELHRLRKDGETELVYDHEINVILKRPNPRDSWPKLMYKLAAYLVMTGNTFPERVRPETRGGKYPTEMYVLRPDKIKIIPNPAGGILKYEYSTTGGKEYFEVDPVTQQADLLHISTFHPLDEFWGASPTQPASREIDSSNDATDWNWNLIRNQGRPGMVFTLVGDIGDDEFDRFEKALEEKFSGPANAARNIIITGDSGTKASPYTMSPSEMDFTEGGRELARRIALAFGVPPMLLGIPGDNTYSNLREARLAFYEGTVLFYLKLITDELNNWLFDPKDQLCLKYDLDAVPAMEAKWETMWERATKADFLRINEKREMTGYEKDPNGDVILVPAGMVPLQFVMSDNMGGVDIDAKAMAVSKDDFEYRLLMGLDEE